MRALLVLLTILLLAPEALAGGDGQWNGKKVVVEDYTSALWDGIVEETVADMNAILPPRAPRLVYARKAVIPCDSIPRRHGRAHRLIVCSGQAGGNAAHTYSRKLIVLADNSLHARDTIACHEFMHAVTGIPDNYGAAPDTSCVWGLLPDPGPVDVAYAKKVYGKKRHR